MEHISKCKTSTTKFLEENVRENLCVPGFDDKVLGKGADLRNFAKEWSLQY